MRRMEPAEWRARRAAHAARVDAWLAPHLVRRRGGVKHPVEDFLFTYYSHRPAQLRRWHPGAGIELVAAEPERDYVATDRGITLDPVLIDRRRETIRWTERLLRATEARPAQFSCFGLHEWAMVYRQAPTDIRHEAWPLRLGRDGTAEVVDRQRIRCTHFDAFRFFTPQAQPLNVVQPTREAQVDNEQPGCLHATMDLYKWAYKLSPVVPSDLVADCFALARDVRALDMRASPYDLRDLGYEPVRIETPEGRAEYTAVQRAFALRAAPLRRALLSSVEGLARVSGFR